MARVLDASSCFAYHTDRRRGAERAVDQILAGSFPASDPPSWTLGIARVDAIDSGLNAKNRGVVDVSSPHYSDRTLLQHSVSLAGAIGIALLVPFVLLLAGLPIALAVRLAEAISWLLARIL